MVLILIGDDYSTLSSFIPQSRDIDICLISRSLDDNCFDQIDLDVRKGLVLLDLSKNTSLSSSFYEQARDRFINFEIWAYYSPSSNIIIKNLESLGYDKVFSSLDNPPESISLFALSTRNDYSPN